jgi:lipopolysaccharide/colanic/teichoic acid biosynthesis glycosyltransferase
MRLIPTDPKSVMMRTFDVLISFFGLIFLSPIIILIFFTGLFDTRSPLFKHKRIGRFGKTFVLIKFRTMQKNTTLVASHLVDSSVITKFGAFLRKTKLDELPQLWNVLKGEMSLVGPRPGLPNQIELKEERNKLNVLSMRPGITGLSQINEIDMSTPRLLARTDAKMIEDLNLKNYFKYIFLTVLGKGSGDRVRK